MTKRPASLFLTAFFASALLVSATLLLLQATVRSGSPNVDAVDPVVARGGSTVPSTRVTSGESPGPQREEPSLGPIALPSAVTAEPDYTSSVPIDPEAIASQSAGRTVVMSSSEDGRDPALSDTGRASIAAEPRHAFVSVEPVSDPTDEAPVVSELLPETAAEPEDALDSVDASAGATLDVTLVSESPLGESAPEQTDGEAVSPVPAASSAEADQAEEESADRRRAPAEPRSSAIEEKVQKAKAAATPAPPQRPMRSASSAAGLPARSSRSEQESPSGKTRWKPMALAPNELTTNPPAKQTKPLNLFPNLLGAKPPPQQAKRPSPRAYNAKVWSALARSKPKAGRRGSSSVTFGIGANGALLYARVSGSSGDSRLDQLALATVRRAAPFPSPPNGAQSFTIRIHFR